MIYEFTDTYQEYQDGLDYKNKISYFAKSDLHWSFYNSQHWRGINAKDLPKITLNITKQSPDYKVAAIMSQNISINYGAENYEDEPEDAMEVEKNTNIKDYTEMLTQIVKMKWEKDKMTPKLREALLNGAVTGDMCFYVYWNPNIETGQLEKGDFCTDVVDGANVFFSNPNVKDVESQDWIILSGRDTVKNLKREAKAAGMPQEEVDKISGDSDYEYQPGKYGKIEMNYQRSEGKATYLIKFWKENGTVMWSKCTRYTEVRKATDLGVRKYPIAYNNWGTIKNSMHGMSDVEGLIDNQISINQLHALVVEFMRKNAFGKTFIDRTKVSGYSNSVSGYIEVDGDLSQAVWQSQPGIFNQAIVNYAQILMQTTKDINGVNDTALGQVDPKNTSAIAVSIKQSSIPLENVQANVYQMVEDWAAIAGEFIMSKYNDRKVQIKEKSAYKLVNYKKPKEDVLLNVRIDVGPSTYFNEIAGQQSLDNLFQMGKITDLQYYERMKKFNIIPDVDGLIEDIKKQQENGMAGAAQQIISQMSPQELQQFEMLPPEQQQAYLQQIMAEMQ